MDDKEAINMLEKQIKALEQAGIDMSGDRTFFYVGEYDLALEGGLVTVWCRSFDHVMCSKGDEPWAQAGRMNFVRKRCGSR